MKYQECVTQILEKKKSTKIHPKKNQLLKL